MRFTANMSQIDPDSFHSYVQTIYNMMKLSDYVTTGEYFMALNDEDLDDLLQSIEKITANPGLEDSTSVENIMMLTILLMTAEGSPDVSEDELHTSMGIVYTYAAMEKMARMGQIEIFHQNMSASPDALGKAKIIAKRIRDDN